jgi:hypothetical protein
MTSFTTIRITTGMLDQITRLADEQGRSTAGMMRTLLRYGIEWVEREAAKKDPKEAGRG